MWNHPPPPVSPQFSPIQTTQRTVQKSIPCFTADLWHKWKQEVLTVSSLLKLENEVRGRHLLCFSESNSFFAASGVMCIMYGGPGRTDGQWVWMMLIISGCCRNSLFPPSPFGETRVNLKSKGLWSAECLCVCLCSVSFRNSFLFVLTADQFQLSASAD